MNGTWTERVWNSYHFVEFHFVKEQSSLWCLKVVCIHIHNTRALALIKCPHLHVGNSGENTFWGISGIGRKKKCRSRNCKCWPQHQEEEGPNYRRSPKIMSDSHSCSYVTWSWTAVDGSLPLCVYTRIRLPFKHKEALYSLPMI